MLMMPEMLDENHDKILKWLIHTDKFRRKLIGLCDAITLFSYRYVDNIIKICSAVNVVIIV